MLPFALPVMVSLPLPAVKLSMLVIRSVLRRDRRAAAEHLVGPGGQHHVRLAVVAVVYSTVLLPPAPSTMSRASCRRSG
jgi:hypothetical protein